MMNGAVTVAEQIAWLQANTVLNQSVSLAIQTALGCSTVWLYTTHVPCPASFLTKAEQVVYAQWHHPNRINSWLLGRTLLKGVALLHPTLLQQEDFNPLDTTVAWQFPHAQVSLSHTATTAYILINTVASHTISIGLDVESLVRKPLSDKALRYLLSAVEYQIYQQRLEQESSARWDLQYWTLKEALYKATPLPYQTELSLANWGIQTMETATLCIGHQSFVGKMGTVLLGADIASVALVNRVSTK